MLLDIQKLILYYMLGVINYSVDRSIAKRKFYSKANLTCIVQLLLVKNVKGGKERINSFFDF